MFEGEDPDMAYAYDDPDFASDPQLYNGNEEYMMAARYAAMQAEADRYNDEYDPYDRPESNVGFTDGQADVDEYGRPVSHYGEAAQGGQQYVNGNNSEDYGYSY
jgi:hypothetical protein